MMLHSPYNFRLVTVPSTAVGNVDGAAEFCHQIYKEKACNPFQ